MNVRDRNSFAPLPNIPNTPSGPSNIPWNQPSDTPAQDLAFAAPSYAHPSFTHTQRGNNRAHDATTTNPSRDVHAQTGTTQTGTTARTGSQGKRPELSLRTYTP